MIFIEEINKLENSKFNIDFIIKKGSIPILFSAPHTMIRLHDEGTIKLN